MIFLAIETSTLQGSLALFQDSRVLHSETWMKERSHSEIITAMVQKCFETSKKSLQELNAIVIDRGPGSFTGLRVGANVAKSLSYILKVPILAVDSLQVIASNVQDRDLPIFSAINAFREMIYWNIYDGTESFSLHGRYQPQASRIEDLKEFLSEPMYCIGNGYSTYQDLFKELSLDLRIVDSSLSFPNATHLGQIAWNSWKSLPTFEWNNYLPLYLRRSEAEEKLRVNAE